MALNRSDKSRILRRYFPGMTRNSEMSTEPNTASFQEKLTDHLPVPVGQFDAGHVRQFLHRRLQLRLLHLVKDGGEPPVCSKIRAAGPPFPKADTHRPMV